MFRYSFEETVGKLEYLQDKFNTEEKYHCPEMHNDRDYLSMVFTGGLYLEDGRWIDFYKCDSCNQRFTTFGKFGQGDVDLEDIEK